MQEALLDVFDVAVLGDTVVNIRARRLAFTHEQIVEEHLVPAQDYRLADNGAVSDNANGDGGWHGGTA